MNKVATSREKQNYTDAKETLQIMLLEIKTQVMTEEKRKTVITDCNKLDGKHDVKKIEYISEQIAQTQIIEIENPKYALITYRGYVFKVDENLNIMNEESGYQYDEETLEYKKQIAKTLTELGVKTTYTQSSDDYIKNIEVLANKNYEEGRDSDIVSLKSDLNSRYVQTISLSNIEGYENFEEEDYIIVNKNMLWENQNDWEDCSVMSKSYDKQTGTLTLGKQKSYAGKNKWTFWNTYDLYAIKRKIYKVNTNNNSSNNKKETLSEFKTKLAKAIEQYEIENEDHNPMVEKTAEEISEYIKKIARKKFDEGVATYMILIQSDISTRYNQTVSVTNIDNYNSLTIDDFLIVNKNMTWIQQNDGVEISQMTKSYNANTGTLEFGMQKSYSHVWTFWNTYNVYLLKKEVINLQS